MLKKIVQSKADFFLCLLGSFILGVAIGSFGLCGREIMFFGYLALLVFFFLLVLFWQNKQFRLGFSCGIFLILGFMRLALSEPAAEAGQIISYHDRLVQITGYVAEEPRAKEKQTVVIEAERVRVLNLETGDKPVAGRVVMYPLLYPRYAYGDALKISCLLKKPESKEDKTYALRLARQGIWTVCLQAQIVSISNKPNGSVYYLVALRQVLTKQINKLLNEPHASFLAGLLFGARANIPDDLAVAFNRTGTTHIIAISGYNITIVATALLALLQGMYIPRKRAFWLAVGGIVFFVLFTGASASVVRAGVMGVVALLARQTGRQSAIGRLLVLTAFLMLLLNPHLLFFDAGFQLSFLATLGLVYVSPVLEKRLLSLPTFFGIKESLISTLSAIIATTPLILFLFGRFSVVAPLANLLILPVIPYTMALGFGALILSFIFFPLGQAVGWVAWLPLTYIIKIVYFFSAWHWAAIEIFNF